MSTASNPLVSVISPVYNGADVLAECIESILAQTYSNWDYVILNNRSTDCTADVARRYAARDPRIRLVQGQEFLPVVANHNAALRLISPGSKYCKLIFADDWLFPECIERMVALAETHPSVGLVSSYGLQDKDVMWTGLPYPSTVVPGREACRLRLLGGPYVFGTGTTHMIRSDFVRNQDPFYNESNLHCDSEVCFQILRTSDFGFIHQILSYTRRPRAKDTTTLASQLHTLQAMTLYELITYGPVYLTEDEFPVRMKQKLGEYYEFLAHSFLEGKGSWEFHRNKLREFGLPLNRRRLAGALFVKAIRAVLKHPGRTLHQMQGGTSVLSGRIPPVRF